MQYLPVKNITNDNNKNDENNSRIDNDERSIAQVENAYQVEWYPNNKPYEVDKFAKGKDKIRRYIYCWAERYNTNKKVIVHHE